MPFSRRTGSIDGQALTDGNIIARNVVGISQCRRCDAVAVSDAVERIAFSNHIELGGGDWCIGRAPFVVGREVVVWRVTMGTLTRSV